MNDHSQPLCRSRQVATGIYFTGGERSNSQVLSVSLQVICQAADPLLLPHLSTAAGRSTRRYRVLGTAAAGSLSSLAAAAAERRVWRLRTAGSVRCLSLSCRPELHASPCVVKYHRTSEACRPHLDRLAQHHDRAGRTMRAY